MADRTSRSRSLVEIRLELTGDAAAVLARSSSEARHRLGSDVERAFSSLLDVLGIAGPVAAVVESVDDLAIMGGRFIRLRVKALCAGPRERGPTDVGRRGHRTRSSRASRGTDPAE